MPELDFDKEFQDFMSVGEGSAITDIYKIIPALTNEQMKIVNTLNFYIARYELIDLKGFLEDYLRSQSKNKDLGFTKSMNMKALLRAYTMEEHMKGVSYNSTRRDEH
jgi:hypothetical protein